MNVLSIREYPDAQTFYSVHSHKDYFYVCGIASNGGVTGSNSGIVLRDYIPTLANPNPNPTTYITTQPWEYHKIKAINNGNDIAVSGTDGNEIGFTAFDIAGRNFVPVQTVGQNESWKFSTSQPLQVNSKVPITNDPNNSQGLILSAMTYASTGHEIEMYMFNNYQTLSNGYTVSNLLFSNPNVYVLEDANTSINISPGERIAWVGNITPVGAIGAHLNYPFFISIDMAFQQQPTHVHFVPNSINPLCYFSLHKVHSWNGDFHCGGFYNYSNNNKTTFTVKPAQAIGDGCAIENTTTLKFNPNTLPTQIDPLPITGITISVNSHSWHQKQYNFCMTDCDDTPLNNSANNNCGN